MPGPTPERPVIGVTIAKNRNTLGADRHMTTERQGEQSFTLPRSEANV